MKDSYMGTLYVVGTPIGNLEDITLRALRILKEADLVLCEDTRVGSKILRHYEIATQTLSYHSHSGDFKIQKIFDLLLSGKNLALITDAGTPGVSDPGASLVRALRNLNKESGEESVKIECIPGPSALTAALSIAGIERTAFTFLGFPPHKKGRETFFKSLNEFDEPALFYESSHRFMKALASLKEFCPEKNVMVFRELTKIHEDTQEGKAEELLEYYSNHEDQIRGEFVMAVL